MGFLFPPFGEYGFVCLPNVRQFGGHVQSNANDFDLSANNKVVEPKTAHWVNDELGETRS